MAVSDPAVQGLVAQVSERLTAVRRRIGNVTDRQVRVVGVTKTVRSEVIEAARVAGLVDFAESYAQELRAKFSDPRPGDRVQFIGHLQTNKVRQVAGLVSVIASVDRDSLVDELARRAPGIHVLLQVNTTGEPSKSGCQPGAVTALVERATRAGLIVDGLMTIGPTGAQRAATLAAFRLLRSIADDHGLEECSMGMSGDLEDAVACGSTQVRIGTALFGVRPWPTSVG